MKTPEPLSNPDRPPARSQEEVAFSVIDEALGGERCAWIEIGPAGDVLRWSVGATRLLGYDVDEAGCRNFSELVQREDPIPGPGPDGGLPAQGGFEPGWFRVKSDKRLWLSGSIVNVPGTSAGIGLLLRDDTVAREAAEACDRSETDAAASEVRHEEFSRKLAHDVRAPLAAALLWLRMIRRIPADSYPASMQQPLDELAAALEEQKALLEEHFRVELPDRDA